MKRTFSISLTNRLALTYSLFICLALGILAFVINLFTGIFFNTLIKKNITVKSMEIVSVMERLYNPIRMGFDTATVEVIGMHFVHEGYIVTVEDENGNTVWDARSCDMQQCMDVINEVGARMEGRFNLPGAMRIDLYPLNYGDRHVGTVSIETYGPYFYSESETQFLSSVNRLLLVAGLVFIIISIAMSVALARTISKPILLAAGAAQKIAQTYSGSMGPERATIRIPDEYRTRELAQLSRSINSLAGELEEAERRQKQLTSDIAHELRTPLSCLRVNIEAMIEGVYPMDREQLASCHEEIMRLANLVQDLNTLTSLEWDRIVLNKTEFDLSQLLHITVEQFRSSAAEKGISINLALRESEITADYDRLKQVFMNILSNAVTYTDSGSITVSVNETGSAGWEVAIADTGIGIPQAELPHVFERFYRSDKSRSRSTGGAGIGLSIAAAIVNAHGGNISAESGKSQGSVFTVTLPRVIFAPKRP
jgi:signal transduction histidine kinase